MKRIIGNNGKEKKRKQKAPAKRVSDNSSAYEFAVNEFHQTVKPTYSNDAGMGPDQDMNKASRRKPHDPLSPKDYHHQHPSNPQGLPPIQEQQSMSKIKNKNEKRVNNDLERQAQNNDPADSPSAAETFSSNTNSETPYFSMTSTESREDDNNNMHVDEMYAMYEETYGDAYVGAPMKYVYPTGYQSMRPRGGPWKISIAICVLFTWLSVFIVGHCSDRAEADGSGQQEDENDDEYVINTRWCGSRMLYLMWVMSMLITGLAAAYCSVIGYIKCRDFTVANTRSQPTGLFGQSDYYVTIQDTQRPSGAEYYKKTIYQSDGTPQFWGGHIYRPTQAAVAVTSR